MMRETTDILVVGAGLSGLAAAVRLHEAGREVLVVDAADAVGGRVRTDRVDGFLLDRGFQVFLDAYPESGRLLDLPALRLQPFEPGALLWNRGRLRPLMDVFRRPGALAASALHPAGNLFDKLRVARLRSRLLRKAPDAIWNSPEMPTLALLRQEGFSERFIDHFFRSFYGGIFLESELETSGRLFEFTFAMFARGSATLPADGMQAIPEQLAARLPPDTLRLGTRVLSLSGNVAQTDRGEIAARRTVLAVDGSSAAELFPARPRVGWKRTACLYYEAPAAPFPEKLIALRGDRGGPVHNLCVPSSIAPSYAPSGKVLVSASVIGPDCESSDLEERVSHDLGEWFGPETLGWRHLATYRIDRALPAATPGHAATTCAATADEPLVCGDHTSSASIEGAILSGLRAAAALL